MEVMSEKSCGIIYAVKMNKENDRYKSIATFMSKYTDTPINYYTPNILENILVDAISDLLNHMKYPSSFWHEYWSLKQEPWNMNDFEAICAALSTVAVMDGKDNYINGFIPIEEFEL